MKIKKNTKELRIIPTANGVVVEVRGNENMGVHISISDTSVFTDMDELQDFLTEHLIGQPDPLPITPSPVFTPYDCDVSGCGLSAMWTNENDDSAISVRRYCDDHVDVESTGDSFELIK